MNRQISIATKIIMADRANQIGIRSVNDYATYSGFVLLKGSEFDQSRTS